MKIFYHVISITSTLFTKLVSIIKYLNTKFLQHICNMIALSYFKAKIISYSNAEVGSCKQNIFTSLLNVNK